MNRVAMLYPGAVRNILVGIPRVEPLELVPFHVDSDIERLPRGQTIHEYL